MVPRVLTFVTVLGIIGGTCYGIFELLELSKVVYIIPLILSFIVVFYFWKIYHKVVLIRLMNINRKGVVKL